MYIHRKNEYSGGVPNFISETSHSEDYGSVN